MNCSETKTDREISLWARVCTNLLISRREWSRLACNQSNCLFVKCLFPSLRFVSFRIDRLIERRREGRVWAAILDPYAMHWNAWTSERSNEGEDSEESSWSMRLTETLSFVSSPRTPLVEKSGVLHIYYANKTFLHWKKRWLHLQDQQLFIYRGKRMFNDIWLPFVSIRLCSHDQIRAINAWKRPSMFIIIVSPSPIHLIQYHAKDIISK